MNGGERIIPAVPEAGAVERSQHRGSEHLGPHLEQTEGYQALWPVLGVPILLAIPFVARLSRAERAIDAE